MTRKQDAIVCVCALPSTSPSASDSSHGTSSKQQLLSASGFFISPTKVVTTALLVASHSHSEASISSNPNQPIHSENRLGVLVPLTSLSSKIPYSGSVAQQTPPPLQQHQPSELASPIIVDIKGVRVFSPDIVEDVVKRIGEGWSTSTLTKRLASKRPQQQPEGGMSNAIVAGNSNHDNTSQGKNEHETERETRLDSVAVLDCVRPHHSFVDLVSVSAFHKGKKKKKH
jgi:hypothetical protein